jgi:hypothetical protein
MKHIEINVIQLLLMIIFIFLFTYLWLPKININKTPEYKKLAIKYLDLLDEKNYWENLYTQMVTPGFTTNSSSNFISQPLAESSFGSKTSAHSSAITPRNIDSNDNALINKFFY